MMSGPVILQLHKHCDCIQDLKPEDYTYQLTQSDLAEIIAGTDAILAKGVNNEEDIKKVSLLSLLSYGVI